MLRHWSIYWTKLWNLSFQLNLENSKDALVKINWENHEIYFIYLYSFYFIFIYFIITMGILSYNIKCVIFTIIIRIRISFIHFIVRVLIVKLYFRFIYTFFSTNKHSKKHRRIFYKWSALISNWHRRSIGNQINLVNFGVFNF